MLGMGAFPSPITSALCGVPSSLTKLTTTCAPPGTTSVASPSVYPSKLNGLFAPGAPATSLNVAVFVAASQVSHSEAGTRVPGAGAPAPPAFTTVSLAWAQATLAAQQRKQRVKVPVIDSSGRGFEAASQAQPACPAHGGRKLAGSGTEGILAPG